MTKSDLVQKLSEQVTTLTKKECEVIVDTVFGNMKESLQRGEKIEIRGFGSFTVRVRRAKEGRNPKTGEEIGITPRKVVTFRPSQVFKRYVNDAQLDGNPAVLDEAVERVDTP